MSAAAPGRPTLDVSALPAITVDSRAVMWWGILLMIAIEGTMLAMAVAAYLFLGAKAPYWPPLRDVFPGKLVPTALMASLLVSLVPTIALDRGAKRNDRTLIRLGLVGNIVFAALATALRFVEFGRLPFYWNSDAYGSAVWAILGFHTMHLVASTVETIVLLVLVLSQPLQKKHLLDLRVDCLYWYFVVLAWIPIYVMLYFTPNLT
jgi:cytochrome c oxidase subunit 1/cytochrome c oxidase subunit I+III